MRILHNILAPRQLISTQFLDQQFIWLHRLLRSPEIRNLLNDESKEAKQPFLEHKWKFDLRLRLEQRHLIFPRAAAGAHLVGKLYRNNRDFWSLTIKHLLLDSALIGLLRRMQHLLLARRFQPPQVPKVQDNPSGVVPAEDEAEQESGTTADFPFTSTFGDDEEPAAEDTEEQRFPASGGGGKPTLEEEAADVPPFVDPIVDEPPEPAEDEEGEAAQFPFSGAQEDDEEEEEEEESDDDD